MWSLAQELLIQADIGVLALVSIDAACETSFAVNRSQGIARLQYQRFRKKEGGRPVGPLFGGQRSRANEVYSSYKLPSCPPN